MNIASFIRPRTLGKVHVPTVTLAHGGGGRAMKDRWRIRPASTSRRFRRAATGWRSPPIPSSSIR
jgi:hypothetical protein